MNNQITAIIVEDEEFPRLSLMEKLKIYHPGIQVIDACDNCDTTLESILNNRPDILFLDIELPEKNALWLLEKLKEISSLPLPYIIFTTAFNDSDYLLKAIKLEAVDYLLKPVALDELTKAIQKVEKKINEKNKNNGEEAERIFTFKTLNAILKVRESELVYFEADGYCCNVYFSNRTTELIFDHLGSVEKQVCNEKMIRAGRKYIINGQYLFKLDVKNKKCYFRLPISGDVIEINLSEGGMDAVMPFMKNKNS